MTTEELLKPRYKVIADYPQWPFNDESDDHKFREGDLLIQCNVNGVFTFKRSGRLGHMSVGVPCCAKPEKYPKIFQRLEWWQERMPEDMPEYVKSIRQEYDYGIKVGRIIKVKEWVLLSETMYVIQSPNREYHPSCFVPATEADYNAGKKEVEGNA